MVVPSVFTRCLWYALRIDLIWCPRRWISARSHVGFRRTATRMLTSFHVASKIRPFLCTSHVGGFGLDLHRSANRATPPHFRPGLWHQGKASVPPNVAVVIPQGRAAEATKDHEMI